MVDADKGKPQKYQRKTKIKNNRFPEISLKSLIIGAVIFLFFPVAAYQQHLDILTVFAAFGPIYIGYAAKSKLKGLILAAIGAIPLLYATSVGALGPITSTTIGSFNNVLIMMCVVILGMGALLGLLGAYLYQSRAKSKAAYEAKKPAGTKNRPIKEDKKDKKDAEDKDSKRDIFKINKPEDTGNVGQNIVNLFKPKR